MVFQNNILAGASGAAADFEIDYSCRFNDNDSAVLYKTFGSAPASDKKFTFSTWIKLGNPGATGNLDGNILTAAKDGSNFTCIAMTGTGQLRLFKQDAASSVFDLKTNALLRDPHAWYHIHVVYDSTPSTPGANDCYLSINGTKITDLATSTYPSQNVTHDFTDTAYRTDISDFNVAGGVNFDGYQSQTVFLDNQKLAASSFGETDDNGVWRPIDITTLTFADNSFLLDFADSTHLGKDVSVTAGADATISNTANTISDSNLSTYTHSSIALGAAVAGRKIVVATTGYGASNASVSSMTIGGVSATFVNSQDNDADADFFSEIWQATVPSGTTGDIVIALSVSCSSNAIGVYRVIGAGQIFDIAGDGTGDPLSAVLEIPAGGVGIGIAQENSASGQSWSWSGLTEDYDDSSGELLYSGASLASASYASTTVVADYSSSTSRPQMTLASFSPTGLNSFVSSGLAANDQVTDTPTDNYCVMSPITGLTDTTLSDGNLAVSSASDEDYILSSMAIDVADSDGWYFEFEETANNASSQMGVATMTLVQDDASPGNDADTYMFELSGGGRQLGSASYQNNATWDSGTNGEIAEDAYGVMAIKGGHIWAGVVADGGGTITWYNGATKAEIEAGTTTNAMTTGALSDPHWISWTHSGTAAATGQFNFGQHAFQGSDIPSGLKKISTSQLPAPTIKDGSAHFQPTIYTGNDEIRNIDQTENSTFQPDLIWIKNRDQADEWKALDNDRGVTKELSLDSTNAGSTDSDGLMAFSDKTWIDASGETLIGNMTENGGLAGAFDGDTVESESTCARATTTGYAGVDWGAGETKTITQMITFGSSDYGYSNPGRTISLSIEGSTDNFSSSVVDLGGGLTGLTDTTTDQHGKLITPTSTTAYRYHRAKVVCTSESGAVHFAEVAFFEDTTTTREGFTLGNGAAGYNDNTEKFVAYQWLESATNGFKVRLVPNAEVSASSTFAHGNTAGKPEFVMTKQVDDVQSWYTWHTGIPENDYFTMETSGAVATGDTVFTAFDATNVSTGSFTEWNDATDFLCLSWVGIAGFSDFGKYTGNGNADGPFVHCGFRPAFVMVKKTTAGGNNWAIYDTARDPSNVLNPAYLRADITNAEGRESDSSQDFDILSNGFKVRNANAMSNTSGVVYIYMAWAEYPFGGDGVSPATAR